MLKDGQYNKDNHFILRLRSLVRRMSKLNLDPAI
jgi:hypothetical protein